jgi:hypothetical protein
LARQIASALLCETFPVTHWSLEVTLDAPHTAVLPVLNAQPSSAQVRQDGVKHADSAGTAAVTSAQQRKMDENVDAWQVVWLPLTTFRCHAKKPAGQASALNTGKVSALQPVAADSDACKSLMEQTRAPAAWQVEKKVHALELLTQALSGPASDSPHTLALVPGTSAGSH